jgi:hypothetical protein
MALPNTEKTAGAGREYVTQERLLYDSVERLGKDPYEWTAIHLHLSQLLAQNRTEARLRIALRLFDQLINTYRSQVFVLASQDFVILSKGMQLRDLDQVIDKVKTLFELDPLTFSESGDDKLYSVYDLSSDYSFFFGQCRDLMASVDSRRSLEKAAPVQLTPKRLGEVVKIVQDRDIAPFIRRQTVIGFTEKGRGTLAFQEFFVSMADLQKAMAPDAQFVGSRWLFDHLCQMLDEKMLKTIFQLQESSRPKQISLNLNLTTLSTPAFQQFLDRAKDRFGIVVEVQIVDIYNDFMAFFRARDMLHDRGHRILIDGFSHLSFRFVDPSQFGADLLKLIWAPELPAIFANQASDLARTTIDGVGRDRLVLARCDTEQAITWGQSQGINMFQGRFLDTMLGAMTMMKCEKSKLCTLNQCVSRRSVVDGAPRVECPNPPMLDTNPDVRTAKH